MAKNTQDYRTMGANDLSNARFTGEWDKCMNAALIDPDNKSWQARAYREGMAWELEKSNDSAYAVQVETANKGQFWRKGSPGTMLSINQREGLALIDFAPNAYARKMCEPLSRFAQRPVAWAATVDGEAHWWVPLNDLTRVRSMF